MGSPVDFDSFIQTPSAPPPVVPNYAWIPVRSLTERHRSRILSHLLALAEHDRYLRFRDASCRRPPRRHADESRDHAQPRADACQRRPDLNG